MKASYNKVLKKLGLTLINENKHLKCKDECGNIYIFSRDYIKQGLDNPRFIKTTNKTVWLKNKKCLN